MKAVADTITAVRQSVPPNAKANSMANHAPLAAIHRRSHRFCRTLFDSEATRTFRARAAVSGRPERGTDVSRSVKLEFSFKAMTFLQLIEQAGSLICQLISDDRA